MSSRFPRLQCLRIGWSELYMGLEWSPKMDAFLGVTHHWGPPTLLQEYFFPPPRAREFPCNCHLVTYYSLTTASTWPFNSRVLSHSRDPSPPFKRRGEGDQATTTLPSYTLRAKPTPTISTASTIPGSRVHPVWSVVTRVLGHLL